jgi:AraC-like DNA-binding protein
MVTRLVLNHWHDWLKPGSLDDPRLFHADAGDRIQIVPPHLGQGYIQEIPLRDDLSLNVHDYQLYDHLLIDPPSENSYLELEFYLEGDAHAKHNYAIPYLGCNNGLTIKRARKVLKLEIVFQCSSLMTYYQAFREGLSPRTQIIFERFAHYLWQALRRPRSTPDALLRQLLQGEIVLPPDIRIEQMLPESFWPEAEYVDAHNYVPTGAAMEPVIGQILSCPYQGATRRTYLTRQVCKLMALNLEAIAQPRSSDEGLDDIFQAASILRRHLVEPPTIESLARQVCTNRFKLNRGFHDVYGITPYGYLRRCRLQKARQLLQTTELTISEVAARVGYTNNSQFTLAFRQLMGLNPKKFQMHVWQQAV